MADYKNKKRYLSYYDLMTKDGKIRPPKHTLSFVQFKEATPQEIELSKAGVSRKQIKRWK